MSATQAFTSDLLLNQEKSDQFCSVQVESDAASTAASTRSQASDCEDDATSTPTSTRRSLRAPPGLDSPAEEPLAGPLGLAADAALKAPPGLAAPWRRAKDEKQTQQEQQPSAPTAASTLSPSNGHYGRAPPGLEECRRSTTFNAAEFRKDLVAILRDLASDRNVGKAVRRVRAHRVPVAQQAREVTDLLTRGAEETRGPIRRSFFAFAAGLATGECSAFESDPFLEGVAEFFREVYPSVCEDAPRFPHICVAELVPTLFSVLPEGRVKPLLPLDLRSTIKSTKDVLVTPSEARPVKKKQAPVVAPPPGLELIVSSEPACKPADGVFDAAAFRKDLVATLRDLSVDFNVGKAVRRVRTHRVPKSQQAAEFSDILTRAAEEMRGPVRRSYFAFACGLAAATPSAFDKQMCTQGVGMFFRDTYPSICEEQPRFPTAAEKELVPSLRAVLPASELKLVLPASLA